MPENEMRRIRIEKVALNIGAGGSGERLEKSKGLLRNITGREPKETEASGKGAFGVSEGRPMGVMVTLRGQEAEGFLEKVFEAKNGEIEKSNFDEQGNLSIGIEEHIDLPGMEYNPEVGILGLDVTVTLERPGFRVKRRKVSKEVGESHKISKEDAINFIQEKFNVKVVGG